MPDDAPTPVRNAQHVEPPVGATVADRDGDQWTRHDDGWHMRRHDAHARYVLPWEELDARYGRLVLATPRPPTATETAGTGIVREGR